MSYHLWAMAERLPGDGSGWTRLRGDQGWRDEQGNLWKKDRLHGDHWDVIHPRTGRKLREVGFDGEQLWPDGPKHRHRTP